MNRILFAAVAAAAVATPAFAQDSASTNQFTGARIGANIGVADDSFLGTDSFTYGAEAGYDFDLNGNTVGLTAEIQDSKDLDRELALTARGGTKVAKNALVYLAAGYSNLKVEGFKLDGIRVGAGVEVAPQDNVFVKLEQRYGNYEAGVHLWQTVFGVGVRF